MPYPKSVGFTTMEAKEIYSRRPSQDLIEDIKWLHKQDQDIVAHERARHVELKLGYL